MKAKWVKKRHQVILGIGRVFAYPFLKSTYHFKYEKFKLDQPYLILSNHVTAGDQFILDYVFGGKAYFVMSDDLVLNKASFKIIDFCAHPLPYKKASTDLGFLKKAKQIVNEGGSLIMFPEGNRTYSGETGYINPTLAKMIKFLKIPLVLVNITDGYGLFPRFAEKKRKGYVNTFVKKVVPYEELSMQSNEQIMELVKKELYVNGNDSLQTYKSRIRAKYLERVLYVCPKCGISSFKSKGNYVKCLKCDNSLLYDEHLQFVGDTPFKNVLEWYKYQRETLLNDKITAYPKDHIFFLDVSNVWRIIPRKKKIAIAKNVEIKMYPDRFVYGDKEIKLDEITSAGCFGNNKFNIFTSDDILQFCGSASFNPLKYVEYIYKYKIEKGEINDDFLGI